MLVNLYINMLIINIKQIQALGRDCLIISSVMSSNLLALRFILTSLMIFKRLLLKD